MAEMLPVGPNPWSLRRVEDSPVGHVAPNVQHDQQEHLTCPCYMVMLHGYWVLLVMLFPWKVHAVNLQSPILRISSSAAAALHNLVIGASVPTGLAHRDSQLNNQPL